MRNPDFSTVRRTISCWEIRLEQQAAEIVRLRGELDELLIDRRPWWGLTLADCQVALVESHLRHHGGRRDLAAKSIGVSERTFYRWCERLGGASLLLEEVVES